MAHDDLIEDLADGLKPVRPIAPARGQLLALLLAVPTVAGVTLLWGVRPDMAHGAPDPAIAIIAGLLALCAAFGAVTVTRMARPSLGSQYSGWRWSLAAVGVVPVVALGLLVAHAAEPAAHAADPFGLVCLGRGVAASLIMMAALFLWVRQGAPSSAERAGLLIGMTAGCTGAFALSVQCDFPGFYHAAFWHIGIVVLATLIGRFGLSRGLRW